MNQITDKVAATTATTTVMERLHDLIPDILVRLPTKSLVRFKSVNNRFFNIITNPRFAKHHARSGGSSPTKVEGLFHFFHSLRNTLTSYIPLHHLPNPKVDKLEKLIRGGRNNNFKLLIETSVILDSCSGLVLLAFSSPSCYCLLNPATNQFQLLTRPVFSCSNRTIYHLRLAYYPNVFSSFDYNLVHVYWERFLALDQEVYSFKIFSSDTNTWRESKEKLTCNRSTFLLKGKALCLNGSVHWIRQCGDIIAFDVKKEQVQIIDLPRGLPKDCFDRAWFGVVDGLIYLVYVLEVEMVIWVLHDYKDCRWSCVKNQIESLRVNHDLYPIFFDDQCLILKSQNMSRDILAYDLKSNEWCRIGKLPASMESGSTYVHEDVFFPFAPTLAVIKDAEFTNFTNFLISRKRKQKLVDAQRQLGTRPKREIRKPARFNDYSARLGVHSSLAGLRHR